MTRALDDAVELLDRSLAYARITLADVAPTHLDRSTPCTAWTLRALLAHMEDALDAFTEAAAGVVGVGGVDPPPPTSTRVDALREKACALLAAWTRAAAAPAGCGHPGPVAVGDAGLGGPLLVAAAALEITVHAWDVGQATGTRGPLPEDLARGLLAVAGVVVDPADRGVRFAPVRPVADDATYAAQLLAFVGRDLAGPPSALSGEPGARGRVPS
ncbi:TIGR03086 family protein [Nocardioides sp. zg-579]|uniref:TIGR03086 family protein n=1 Tax=Nocardioides marmotae TaxID=2663857 RepID=A0A6I3JDX1_9ACTN|nr:TIGR03086 family metal-binding protein [Nocardioides marmotae]MCR6032714.1 TIGR03086 family protein [Gordonia jinghuaiqii]MTB96364.1 TIGR03086 family protein [Nocardioides marmotae]QKE03156.1 TIGR03086 family protein [Nocardioides marmotae]